MPKQVKRIKVEGNTELHDFGLDKFIAALSGDGPKILVGILGGKDVRKGEGSSNATIGAKHEFGLDGLPMRSFLRMPLSTELSNHLKTSGALDQDVLLQVMHTGKITPWLEKIAIVAETTVQDAFDTGGYGKWKPSNMTYKKVRQTLVETQQLRNSITSEVKE